MNKVFLDWLHRRKINDKVIKDFAISSGMNKYIGESILIPVHDLNGKFSFYKYRRSPLDSRKPKYLYDEGGKVTLYGGHLAKDEKTILITEGELDCLVAWSANIPSVTSTGGALSFQNYWGVFFADKEVVICFDNDAAGGEGMVRVLKYIPHAKVMFIPDRANVKDISDYVENGGNLGELMKTAKLLNSPELVRQDRADRISLWQSVHFHDAYIKEYERPIKEHKKIRERGGDGSRLDCAKTYPLDELLEFRRGKTKCLWHNEDTGSLHYYPKTNTAYCFGQCGRTYDVIDVYRQLHNCSFKEAVDALQ